MISAKIITDSISEITGDRLTTYELEIPRFILAELNTHKMLSKNTQSSRAVPAGKVVENIEADPVYPMYYGKNKSGMQAGELMNDEESADCMAIWNSAMQEAIKHQKELAGIGLHKQWANRIVEPFQFIKVVISGTEWENFFWLRIDDAAQPEIRKVAELMLEKRNKSIPAVLQVGQWHLPYVTQKFTVELEGELPTQYFYDSDGLPLTLEEAKKISTSCCAQVSYRKLNDTREKALEIYDKLFTSGKPHLSPTEHQGTPIEVTPNGYAEWPPKGISHVDIKGDLWSANFKGFIQYRKIMEQSGDIQIV